MEERKFITFKKEEFSVKEFVKKSLGKGRISYISIEYTPIGEKIIVATTRPGFIIGKRGEKIAELTAFLKKKFRLENPHIEIQEIKTPEFDARIIADEIALAMEKLGTLKFKVIAYKMLDRVMRAGALGAEFRLSGRLPSERAKSWRFASGYLKKTGDSAKIVERAKSVALTHLGVIGIQVSILPPDRKIHDKIDITEELKNEITQRKLRFVEQK